MTYIPYATQWIDEDDIQAVVEVLRSDWLTQGPAIERFEMALAKYCGAKYAVAVSSGTAALHLACLAAGVTAGGKVVTSPITFVASANCALYAGGEPRFVDIEPGTLNLSAGELSRLLEAEGIKAVVPVHFSGRPCDMEAIGKLAAKYDLAVIEDACHALGAEYRAADGQWVKVGSCRHSDMTVFSFHPVKHVATGEGGAITTNSSELYEKLRLLRTHGITKDEKHLENHDGPWYYEMQALGYNYRITDFQCALGASQLAKLDGWLERRRAIAGRYDEAFAGHKGIRFQPQDDRLKSAHHLYVIQVDERDRVFAALRAAGLGVQVHYIPVHLQPYYQRRFDYHAGDFPAAENYYRHCISIPIFPRMTDGEVETVLSAVIGAAGGK